MSDFKRKDAQKLAYRVAEMIEAMRTEMAGQDATIQRQAAEIERLRAAGDAIAAVLASLCGDRQDVCRLLDAWREARRG